MSTLRSRFSEWRRSSPAVAAALVVACLFAAPLASATERMDTVVVTVDHAKVIRLPERTNTVIVGNPAIADVSVQRNGILVITGRSFGVTNLIALDAQGGLLAESRVNVRAPQDSVVTVQRGMDRESYACSPTCQPSLQLGDSPAFFGSTGSQSQTRNQLAQPQR